MTDLCKKGREVHGLMIRKAILEDIPAIAEIYDEIHTEEEAGHVSIGWSEKSTRRGKLPKRLWTAEICMCWRMGARLWRPGV